MKKRITWILPVLLIISIVDCDNSKPQPPSDKTPEQRTTGSMESSTEPKGEQYMIGDIILADSSVVNAEGFTDVDSNNLPVAVIAGIKDDGTALGLGVHRSSTPLQWALENTIGNKTRFMGIVCTQDEKKNEDAVTAIFTGAADGSDNWDIICSIDGQGTEDAAKNYPAFHFVDTYAGTYKLTGIYASGWYMPGISELCTVYKNREKINASLQKINERNDRAAMESLGTNWYWSSSQSGSRSNYAWFVHYFNGYVCDCPKDFSNLHVLAVRSF